MLRITRLVLAALLAATASVAAPLADFMSAPAPESLVYAERSGRPLHAHVFRPADLPPGEARPAIVWIHGGAWIGGNPDGFMPHARYFASRGLVGVNLTYRLAKPGETTLADCIADVRSALRYLRAHASTLGLDPARIAVAGDSAGGHLAAALATLPDYQHPSDDLSFSGRPDALILYNPVLDLTQDDWIRFAVGGPALADRKKTPRPVHAYALDLARSLSPVFHVSADLPPTLLLHPRHDRVVPVSQAERFAAAALAAGARCELVTPEDPVIGHAFVIAGWKHPEPVVVEAIHAADRFLASLGWLAGEPTLEVSDPPAFTPRRP
jgi:acetyl esterase/lipase